MNITLKFFQTLFPEFKERPAETIEAYIAIASTRVPQAVWASNTAYATSLLTAHMLTASGRGGLGSIGGAVTDESVGDMSRGASAVGDQASGDAELRTTRYGIDFIALRRETIIGVSVGYTGGPRRWWP